MFPSFNIPLSLFLSLSLSLPPSLSPTASQKRTCSLSRAAGIIPCEASKVPTQTTDAGFQRQLRCVSMRRHAFAALRLPAPAAGADSCRRDAEGVQVAINHLHV